MNNTKGKVLFIATVYTHLAAFHLPFMQLLQAKGYEVHAAASSDEGRKKELEFMGVRCWEIPFSRSPYSLKNWCAIRELGRLFGARRFDLIHVHTPVAGFLGRFLARVNSQGPVLYTAHGFHFYKGAPLQNRLIYYNMERLAARWTSGLIVMNEEDLDAARGFGLVEGENLFTVHGVGVDLNTYSNCAVLKGESGSVVDADLKQGCLIVICVAEFIPRKNHLQLLQAWRLVSREIPGAVLWLVGSGKSQERIRRTVSEWGLDGSVRLLGYRRDVPELLMTADLLVLVSRHEGLPRAIMEAMAAGKPVVASDVRGNRDLVQNGVNGLLVPLDDPKTLAEAVIRVLKDPGMRRRMGEAGRQMIKPYSLDRVKEEMWNIYRRFL